MKTWICDCGIVNWMSSRECLQCGATREEGWDLADRQRQVLFHVYDPFATDRINWYDVTYQIQPDHDLSPHLVPVAHWHRLRASERPAPNPLV